MLAGCAGCCAGDAALGGLLPLLVRWGWIYGGVYFFRHWGRGRISSLVLDGCVGRGRVGSVLIPPLYCLAYIYCHILFFLTEIHGILQNAAYGLVKPEGRYYIETPCVI